MRQLRSARSFSLLAWVSLDVFCLFLTYPSRHVSGFTDAFWSFELCSWLDYHYWSCCSPQILLSRSTLTERRLVDAFWLYLFGATSRFCNCNCCWDQNSSSCFHTISQSSGRAVVQPMYWPGPSQLWTLKLAAEGSTTGPAAPFAWPASSLWSQRCFEVSRF